MGQAAYRLPQAQDAAESPPTLAPAPAPAPHATIRVRVWDAPVRIFHWSLLVAVATAIVTGQQGGDWMRVHGQAGLSIVGLVTFRLVWGLVGTPTARFAHFAPTPAKLRAYLRGQWRGVGHNPLGAFSVFALLGLLAAQAATGLFSNDDIAFTGPLAAWVDDAVSSRLTGLHHQLATVLYALLVLHVLAIVFYTRVKKDRLVQPMVTGFKNLPADHAALVQASQVADPTPRSPIPRAAGLVLALGLAVLVVYVANGTLVSPAAAAAATANSTPAATAPPALPASSAAPAW